MTVPAESIESVRQLTAVWRALVLDRDAGADVRDLPGIAVRWADSRFAFWNCVTLTEAEAGADPLGRRLGQAADIMRAKKHPGYLWLFEDLLDDEARSVLEKTAEQVGLKHAFSGTGMAADLPSLAEPAHPDLTFARVRTDEQLRAYADLQSRAYGFPLEEGRDGLAGSALWRNGVHAYLAARGDEAVACAATVAARGRLHVVFVATDPRWQRRGYGEAVTRKALYEGARATGLTRATLHATAAGAPVYPRIGFEANTRIHFYFHGGKG
ncbi:MULTISPECIES: GNAT family N-acetyltransferase [Streptomyces]|uniref:GNAT family N-acetyltransferase n=1 Tax=Streptomyces TaxID=1883 RepID=UPI00163C8092|nr:MULTISPECIES: GNAT family N-acetyltransferase [Streptomyces]MBC2878646.1 GNAT family N-acetyltransferase [Streptomyces sp. TYQ1024]UBI35297.1 GNAT family N-acetyltransferase [Streptomyces mobaraensis]UKW27888.1 GNAT family N-acetyltransferase [Streptomyces sp. TYQ1024]